MNQLEDFVLLLRIEEANVFAVSEEEEWEDVCVEARKFFYLHSLFFGKALGVDVDLVCLQMDGVDVAVVPGVSKEEIGGDFFGCYY